MPLTLTQLHAREILDSRGNPTLAVRATLSDGSTDEAMVPSGASTGEHEALELRDNDPRRYHGKGVLNACAHVNTEIAKALIGQSIESQSDVDRTMITLDGTENKARLGANAILGVSLAIARARTKAEGVPLYRSLAQQFGFPTDRWTFPIPMMNVLNGGVHADSGLDVQEYMIVPQHVRFSERVRIGSEVFHSLKEVLKERGDVVAVGDEGGFAPHVGRNEEALVVLHQAITAAGYTPGNEVKLAIDTASSELFKNGRYTFDAHTIDAQELIETYERWTREYHLVSIEDGLAEDDWENWRVLTERLGARTQLIGDDLFATDVKRVRMGIENRVANSVLIKPNQIGTLSETIEAVKLAQHSNYTVVISHRSGETEDTTIADLAVAVGAQYIKTGSLSRSERVAKYNRLMAIEEEIHAAT
ncbi:MAG: phosphopyruvate hydratase [Candidatus Kerfeldbacteria bacterium]|nr:phosphopyruvate hydratase [Candidatus Kerfeldbacteria bacterium]